MSNNTKYLLPIGFYDLLFDEAKIGWQSTNIIFDRFYNFGYRLIKTPLVEFERNLRKNRELHNQSFRMVDLFSNRNLILRSDITPQITRLVKTKFNQKDFPLRLCYLGDVLQVKNSDLYPDRQSTQAGIELIGDNSNIANWEVINVALAAINDTKLPNLIIDFCLPQFLQNLLPILKIKNTEELKEAISTKNISAITKLGGEYKDKLIKLALGGSDFKQIKQELLKLPISSDQKQIISDLEFIIDNIRNNYPQIEVLFNPFEDSDFLYHKNIAFTVFERDFSYPIARGGRYLIEDKIPASGATIYVNNMRRILQKSPGKVSQKILVPSSISAKEINDLQKKGYITIYSLDQNSSKEKMIDESRQIGCDLFYFSGKEIMLTNL